MIAIIGNSMGVLTSMTYKQILYSCVLFKRSSFGEVPRWCLADQSRGVLWRIHENWKSYEHVPESMGHLTVTMPQSSVPTVDSIDLWTLNRDRTVHPELQPATYSLVPWEHPNTSSAPTSLQSPNDSPVYIGHIQQRIPVYYKNISKIQHNVSWRLTTETQNCEFQTCCIQRQPRSSQLVHQRKPNLSWFNHKKTAQIIKNTFI